MRRIDLSEQRALPDFEALYGLALQRFGDAALARCWAGCVMQGRALAQAARAQMTNVGRCGHGAESEGLL